MADITTTARGIILEKVQALVEELINVNNRAKDMEIALAGLSDADAEDTIDKLLSVGGLASTDDTISAEIYGILSGTISVTVNGVATALSWTHASS